MSGLLLQPVLTAGSSMLWPKAAACTSVAPSAGTSSAAAATTPTKRWGDVTSSGKKAKSEFTLLLCARSKTLNLSRKIFVVSVLLFLNQTKDGCLQIEYVSFRYLRNGLKNKSPGLIISNRRWLRCCCCIHERHKLEMCWKMIWTSKVQNPRCQQISQDQKVQQYPNLAVSISQETVSQHQEGRQWAAMNRNQTEGRERLHERRNYYTKWCLLVFKTNPPKVWLKVKLTQNYVFVCQTNSVPSV